MDSRTRLAIGGMAAVAASVTVICVVALTNSVALSETAGSPIDGAPIVVPASGGEEVAGGGSTPRATPTPSPTPNPAPTPVPVESEAPGAPGDPSPGAEVVPAPDAQVVTPTRPSPVAEQPAKPSSPSTPSAPSSPSVAATLDEAIALAQASGSWAPVRAWAEREGWSEGRIRAYIARLERELLDERLQVDSGRDLGTPGSDSGLVESASTSTSTSTDTVRNHRGSLTGSSTERPAYAGAGADRTERPGLGAKKDRSRDFPVRRDR